MTAALAGTMAANFFYLTMQFYYFYAFAVLVLALPIVFSRARASVNDVARAGVILCLGLSIAFGAIYFPRALSDLEDTASNNSALSFSDREVAGGNGIVNDQEAVYQAKAIIPQSARYRVVTGSGLGPRLVERSHSSTRGTATF